VSANIDLDCDARRARRLRRQDGLEDWTTGEDADDLSPEEIEARLRTVLAHLDTVSHVNSTQDYSTGPIARDTSDSLGGRKPSHGAGEHPRGAKEVESFRSDYRLHSADEFKRRLAKAKSDTAKKAILSDAEEAIKAWKKSPLPGPNEMPPFADPKWKAWVAAHPEVSAASIADKTGLSRQYVTRVRAKYRAA
jgi:hypothetical protein